MVLTIATTNFTGGPRHVRDPHSPRSTQVLLINISRAHFKAKAGEADQVYVQFPPEAGVVPGMRWLLHRHTYRTRRAAEGRQDECSSSPVTAGFVECKASACVFMHPSQGIAVSVHGDDFTATGPKEELDRFEAMMRSSYKLAVGGRLVPGKHNDKEATVLNQVVGLTDFGIQYEESPAPGRATAR